MDGEDRGTRLQATIILAEHRIRQSVQHEIEKLWKDRMKEDKITTNKFETLHSQVVRLSEEVVCMKNRHHGSAVSAVAASVASGGSTNNFTAPVMPNTFCHPYRIERPGVLEEHPRHGGHDGRG